MGNRAVITTLENYQTNGLGIYLHWNGGRDSIEAFLEYCKIRKFRSGEYGFARLTQIIANYFGGGLSIGIDQIRFLDCDNWDNGVYLIDNWEIVGRRFKRGFEQDEYNLMEMVKEIDKAQPESDRVGSEIIEAIFEGNRGELQEGDRVAVHQYEGWTIATVRGFVEEWKNSNGEDLLIPELIPYVDIYSNLNGEININNKLTPTREWYKMTGAGNTEATREEAEKCTRMAGSKGGAI